MMSTLSLLDMEELSLFMEEQGKGGVFGETGGDDFGFDDGGVGNESPIFDLIVGTESDTIDLQESTRGLPSDSFLENWVESMDLQTLLGEALDETDKLLQEDLCTDLEGTKVEVLPDFLTSEVSLLDDSGIDLCSLSSPEPPSPQSSSSISDSSRSSSPSTVASSSLEELLLASPAPADQGYDESPVQTPHCVRSKRSKPYSKTDKSKSARKTSELDDTIPLEFLSKKERKKVQNKNAAIRYRQKKKMENDQIKDEVTGLESRNVELSDKVDQLTREIKYMKDLIAEIYKAKGLIKS